MQGRRFLAWFAGVMAFLAAAAAVLTVSVDPYYVFGSPLVRGWNVVKPAAYNRDAPAKTYLLERAAPRTLLLGNSRIEVGLNPDSPEWPADMRPVFNAGLAGRELSISAKLLEDALAVPGLRHVVVGVDLLDFLEAGADVIPPGPVDAGPDGNRVRVRPDLSPNSARWIARARDMIDATLTIDAVADSVSTVLAQRQPGSVTLTPEGFSPMEDYRLYVRQHGFRDLFDNKYEQYAARFPRYPRPDFAIPYRTPSFAALREIVATSLAHNLDLVLVIYPYHAAVMDLLRQNGLWASGEAWRRALANVVSGLDPAGRVRIVDFSGYNQYTTEGIPAPGDLRTELRWYWEPGHFQSTLGDMMIRRLYREGEGFGRDLTAGTADQVNAALAAEAAAHPVPPPKVPVAEVRRSGDTAGLDRVSPP